MSNEIISNEPLYDDIESLKAQLLEQKQAIEQMSQDIRMILSLLFPLEN